MDYSGRAVALIDMDCFYCACERALQPDLYGKPLVVVQYNPYEGDGSAGENGVKAVPAEPAQARLVASGGTVMMPSASNGSLIAVSYEARERGVTRFMRGNEALAQCPDLNIMRVPTAHGKSDMNLYRRYGAKVRKIVSEVCGTSAPIEKASVDEMYIDLTTPAKNLLSTLNLEEIAQEAADGDTHVAGAAEGASEAAMGQQKNGPLGRSAFRSGHAGQIKRSMNDASAHWWNRKIESWLPHETLLCAAAVIVARARNAVTQQLGFTCSAGIATNKMLAKLCGGLHKPNQQTVLPEHSVTELLDPLPVDRLRGFGGKLGDLLKRGKPELGIEGFESVGALRRAGEATVAQVLRGEWRHPEEKAALASQMACGRDDAMVEQRPFSKHIGGGKNFSGTRMLDNYEALETWIREFAGDVWGRLEEEEDVNERIATQLVVHVNVDSWKSGRSKRCKLRPGVDAMVADAMTLMRHLLVDRPAQHLGIVGVGLSGDNFISSVSKNEIGALQRMFKRKIEDMNTHDIVECVANIEQITSGEAQNNFRVESTSSPSKKVPACLTLQESAMAREESEHANNSVSNSVLCEPRVEGALERMFKRRAEDTNAHDRIECGANIDKTTSDECRDFIVDSKSSPSKCKAPVLRVLQSAAVAREEDEYVNKSNDVPCELQVENSRQAGDSSELVIIDVSQNSQELTAAMPSAGWSCNACTFRNEAHATCCEMCSTPRPQTLRTVTSKPRSRSRKARGRPPGSRSEQKCQKMGGIAALLLKSGKGDQRVDQMVVEV